jgi:hypothetical protein
MWPFARKAAEIPEPAILAPYPDRDDVLHSELWQIEQEYSRKASAHAGAFRNLRLYKNSHRPRQVLMAVGDKVFVRVSAMNTTDPELRRLETAVAKTLRELQSIMKIRANALMNAGYIR